MEYELSKDISYYENKMIELVNKKRSLRRAE